MLENAHLYSVNAARINRCKTRLRNMSVMRGSPRTSVWRRRRRSCFVITISAALIVAAAIYSASPSGNSPWRMPPVFTSVKKADAVARRISKVRLAPQPALINKIGFKFNSSPFQLLNFRVQILRLEVDHCRSGSALGGFVAVERKGRTRFTFESRVSRWTRNDLCESHLEIEGHRLFVAETWQRDLV